MLTPEELERDPSTQDEESSKKTTTRILVVDDEEIMRAFLKEVLASEGYAIDLAVSGRDAVDKMGETQYDIIITDIVMPGGMTGTELAKRALIKKPNLKVLYTSGYTDTTVFDDGLLERNNAVLNKPYGKDNLAQAVRDVLDRE